MAKGVVLALKLAAGVLFVRKLCGYGHIVLNLRAVAIAALAFSGGCAHGTAASQNGATPIVLGIPLYPGAEADPEGTFTEVLAREIHENAAFQTGDSFERVVAFYRRRLPLRALTMNVTTGNGQAASFGLGSPGNRVTIEIAASKPGETDLLITRVRASTAAESSATGS
jgi:hypothetical protein